MEDTKRAGRTVGVLILLQMLGSGLVNGVLEAPLFGSPGFLIAAAPHARQIGLGAVLSVVTEGLWLGIGMTVFSLVYNRAPKMALGLMALTTVALAAALAEAAGVMSMVSLSEAYAKGGPAERAQLEAVRVIVASNRNWAHFLGKVVDGVTIFVFYAIGHRLALVPRAIAVFGLLAAVLMLSSVGRPLFGYEVVFPLLAPLGLSQLILAVWLLSKGLREPAGGRR